MFTIKRKPGNYLLLKLSVEVKYLGVTLDKLRWNKDSTKIKKLQSAFKCHRMVVKQCGF